MFHVCLYYSLVLSVASSIVVTCWERADLLTVLCVMFPCVFVTFPYGVLGQVWYLIVSIPDLCIPLTLYLERLLRKATTCTSWASRTTKTMGTATAAI